MAAEGAPILAKFWLHMRCHNCHLLCAKTIKVPEVEDAPRDIDELLDSELMRRLPFRCRKCDNPIGSLVAVKQVD